MGYWGSFVVCRFAHDFEDVEAIFDRVGPPVEEWAVGGWRFGQFAGQELEGSAKDVLDALVDLTGAPVLMAYIVDSDAAVIDAATPVDDHWRGCLGRRAMRAATAQIGEDFNTRFLSADAAARNAAMWAHDAGLVSDPAALRELFTADTATDLFIEADFFRLLAALGLPSGPGKPDAGFQPARPD